MHCDSCNTAFADGTKACPTCGSPVASQDATPLPAYHPGENEISYSGYIPFIDAVASSTAPSTSVAEPQTNNSIDTQQAMSVLSTPVPLTRRAISTGTVVALTLLVLLLLIEGCGFAYYGAIVRPTDLRTQATSVARTFLTSQANSVALEQAQATATANVMAPDELYKQATSGAPVIDDPLSVPGSSIFYQYNYDGTGCNFKGGAYHLSLQQPGENYCIGYNVSATNFVMQAQVAIIHGDNAGLAFRVTDVQTANYYFFVYDYTGAYGFFVMKQGKSTQIKAGYSLAIIRQQSHPNLLTVIARNNHFYLYINKQPVDQVFDDTYSSGMIGLLGESSTGNLDIAFANAKLWEL